jgi:DNA-binding XRE family transcriptional regulator
MATTTPQISGAALRILRRRRGFRSAQALATAVGCDRSTIYRVEQGLTPSVELTIRIAAALDLPVDDLYRLAAA